LGIYDVNGGGGGVGSGHGNLTPVSVFAGQDQINPLNITFAYMPAI